MRIEFTFRGLLSVFFRQRKKAIAVFAICLIATAGYLAIVKAEYESYGSLLVKFGNSPAKAVEPTANGEPEIISQNDRREIMESDTEILQSHNLLLALVHEFGAERLYPGIVARTGNKDWPDEVAVRQLLDGDLWVKAGSQSDVIEVKLMNQNPVIAAQFLHRLFEVFITRQSEVFNKPQTDILQQEIAQAKIKLGQSQQTLQEFREKNGISSIDNELSELLRQKSDAGSTALETNENAWANLSQLQAKEQQMLQTYRADSPQVKQVHESVVLAERQLHMQQGDLSSRTGSARVKIDRRIAQLEGLRTQYNDLERQVDIDAQNYKNYQLRAEDARVDETLNKQNITPISVIDEPLVPKRPVRPRKTITVLIGLFAALVFGSGTAMIFETLDPRFSTPLQVSQALKTPVMASFDAGSKGRA